MNRKQRRRIEARLQVVRARIKLIEARLEGIDYANHNNLPPVLQKLLEKAMADNAEISEILENADKNADGVLDYEEMEELVDLVSDWLDEHVDTVDERLSKFADMGIDILAWVAITVIRKTEPRLERRLERLRKREAALAASVGKKKTSTKKASAKKAPAKKAAAKKAPAKKKAAKKKAAKKG